MKQIIYRWLEIIGFSYCLQSGIAIAQISPDQTIPTQVEAIDSQEQFVITGGSQAGKNLFHSFKEFSVPNGSIAYFNNSGDVVNIISRVTGGAVSQIDGVIAANGAANLFIINPMGFIFGPNAKLEIGGSFIASSASSIKFADGTEFGVNQLESSVLTVAVPIGLQFGQTPPGSIINRSQSEPANENSQPPPGEDPSPSGLRLEPNKTFALIGGAVTLDKGHITAFAGRIELGSVGENSYVSLTPTEKGWQAGYEGVQNYSDVLLTQSSVVDGSGDQGSVQIQGRRITFSEGVQIGLVPKDGEDTSTGDLTINGSESVELIGRQIFNPGSTTRTGLFVIGFNVDGGKVIINTQKFSLRDGALINTETGGAGKGGDILINASESAEITGVGFKDSSLLLTATSGFGKGGNVVINTQSLTIRDGGQISADTVSTGDTVTEGAGGTIIIKAPDSVEVSGKGIIPLDNREVPSQISASSGYRSLDLSGFGNGGSINIETNRLIVGDGAKINVESFQRPEDFDKPSGVAGLITIKANSILLDKQGQFDAIAENNNGNGGEINLVSDRLELRGQSSITAQANSGNGGNIDINSRFVITVPTENSDIVANAGQGNGGNIDITASGLFGLRVQKGELIPLSEINASSRAGVSGIVTINRPDVDSQSNLVTLPTEVINTDNLVVQSCRRTGVETAGEFSIRGRGGLPVDPNQTVSFNQGLADFGNLSPTESSDEHSINQAIAQQPSTETIVEAQGWMTNEQGQIVLTAQATTVTSQPHNNPTKCSGP